MDKMEPSSEQIEQLRSKFYEKIREEEKSFHPKDLSRVAKDDSWLRRFLLHHDLDLKDALAMLMETCEWRLKHDVNSINENNVNLEYLKEGSLFVHSRDKDGKSLFIFKSKKHEKGKKDFEELKRCVIYWFERVERQDKGDQITIFFDMADTGLANMDMDYTKYLINLCKQYYPYILNYILIFEMPWVLNAAFTIIKTWLPQKAVEKIKFVSKKSLKDYVDSSHALVCWGGTDDYEFVFQPESNNEVYLKIDENKKKVHFADGSPISENCFSDSKQDDTYTSLTSFRLKIIPQEIIIFNQEGIELSGTLSITNISDIPISFKIKTTSPEKFRVRPSCAILEPNETSIISVILQSGYTGLNIIRDKFLIMSLPLESENYQKLDLNDTWKSSTDSKKVEQHRLKCIAPGTPLPNGSTSTGAGTGINSISPLHQQIHTNSFDLEQKINQLLNSVNHGNEINDRIINELNFTKKLIYIILIVLMFFTLNWIRIVYSTDKDDNAACHSFLQSKSINNDEL